MKTHFLITLLLVSILQFAHCQFASVTTTPLSSANGPIQVDYPIELAILVDASSSINNHIFQMAFDSVRKMPDSFIMSETEVRMAVIIFSDQSRVLLGLTSDQQNVRNLKTPGDRNGIEPSTGTNLALRAAKEKIFKKSRPDAHKIVYLITDGRSDNFETTEDVADELRRDGVLIYVGTVGDQYENDALVMEHLRKISTEGLRGVFAENSTQLAMMVVEKLMKVPRPL